MLGPVSSQMRPASACAGGDRSQSLATNAAPSRGERLFDHGVPSAVDDKLEARIDLGPCIVAVGGELRQRTGDVEHRERFGRFLDRRRRRRDARGQPLECLDLDAERAVGGAGDLGFEFAQLGGREAHLAGERLAMDERRVERRRHQLVAVLGARPRRSSRARCCAGSSGRARRSRRRSAPAARRSPGANSSRKARSSSSAGS